MNTVTIADDARSGAEVLKDAISKNTKHVQEKVDILAGCTDSTAARLEELYKSPNYAAIKNNDGTHAGGERGQDGSGGVLGGRQTAVGTSDYQGFGAATPFYTGSSSASYTYSGGGAGWFSGASAAYGASAAGGSSYVGNMPTFTHNGVKYKTLNESDINEGNGYAYVRFVMPCKVE